VDHEAKDTHHGGTPVVQLDGTLGKLGLLIKGIPAEVKGSVTEVTHEFTDISTVGLVIHDSKLKSTHEGNNLSKSSSRDGIRSVDDGPAVGRGVEGVSGVINVSGKVNSVTGDNLPKEGKLSDTAVLDLDVMKMVETVLVGIVEHAQRIEESKRGLGSELGFEGVDGRGDTSGLDGAKAAADPMRVARAIIFIMVG